MFTHLSVCCPHQGSFPRNTKQWAKTNLRQDWKNVTRYFVKLGLSNVVTKLVLRYKNVTIISLLNAATTLSSDVGEAFISNELTTSIQPMVDIVTTSLSLLGGWMFSSNSLRNIFPRTVLWLRHEKSSPDLQPGYAELFGFLICRHLLNFGKFSETSFITVSCEHT